MSKESQLAQQRSVADARLAAITAQLARWRILSIITNITTIATIIIVFVIILIVFVLVDIKAQLWRLHNAHPQKSWKKITCRQLLSFSLLTSLTILYWSIGQLVLWKRLQSALRRRDAKLRRKLTCQEEVM